MEIVRLPKVSRRRHMSGTQEAIANPQPAAPAFSVRGAGRQHLRLVGGAAGESKSESASDKLVAPSRIVAETRAAFRKEALAFMEQALAGGVSSFDLDMQLTSEVDASGLGVLVVIQKRSKELGVRMRVARASQPVRYLLLLTKLEHLFEFAD